MNKPPKKKLVMKKLYNQIKYRIFQPKINQNKIIKVKVKMKMKMSKETNQKSLREI
jgi:hypothetical protein